MFRLGEGTTDARRGNWNGAAIPAFDCLVALELVSATSRGQTPRLTFGGTNVIVELDLPTGLPGTALYCRFHASPAHFSRLHRELYRTANHRRHDQIVTGMILLLALCGWVIGGADGARQAVSAGTPSTDGTMISPDIMRQRYGATPLRTVDAPALFDILADICRRAGLPRMPDLYRIARYDSMNAYALGGPHGSAIVVTDGLLRGMTLREIAGILAHEVAHIRHNDAGAMGTANALHRAIALTSLFALASLRAQSRQSGPSGMPLPLAIVLGGAPAIGQLLCLGLSRLCELQADAAALDLIDDPHALIAALDKLEHHHAGARAAAPDDDLMRFLHSHPATAERVGTLNRLA